MSTVFTLLQQVIIMFLLAGVGYVMFRTKKISQEGSRCLGNILIYLSLPCVIINGFLVERTTAKLWGLLFSSLAAAIILAFSILISRLFFKKDPIAHFASSFANPGFFGIPLILSCIGNDAVFYVAAFIAFLNMLQWTYGVSLLTGEKASFKPKALLKAPFMIAIIIGLSFFLTGLPMPTILDKSMDFLAGLNTPLAMFTTGIYLAQTDLVKMLRNTRLYVLSAVRLLLIPAISLAVLSLLPADLSDMKMAILIASACPVGSNVAVYAQLHNSDYPYAVETVVISTMLSILTLPIIVQAATLLW